MSRPDLYARFDPTPAAVREARSFLRTCLEQLGVDGQVDVETLLMAANELTTNAVLHGRTEFEVRVRLDERELRLEFTDASNRLPQPCRAPEDATSGRGLALVESSGLLWGVDKHLDGKTVWLQAERGDGATARAGGPASS